VDLGVRVRYALPALAYHLYRHPPDVALSHMSLGNSWTLISRRLARKRYPVICVEHNTLSVEYQAGPSARQRIPALIRRTHRWADAIVSISQASADDLERLLGPSPPRIEMIYNPVVSDQIEQLAAERAPHPWFDDPELKIVITIGRLENQKNFPRLIRAFAGVVREEPSARLVILGEGSLRGMLKAEITGLGLDETVALPGFFENPYSFLSRSAVFALSSIYEGLPTVVIEAMACGTPIVSTDSAGGVREILEDGRYGVIVPQDDDALRDAILFEIRNRAQEPDDLRRRAGDFTVSAAVVSYERLIESVLARGAQRARR
jgi:glycosyltransferase involved in cell wall biosynthesis